MYCSKCGKKVPDDALFCEHCGKKIAGPVTQAEIQSSQKPTTKHKPHKPVKSRIAALCLGFVLLCFLGISGTLWLIHGSRNSNSAQPAVPAVTVQESDAESAIMSVESSNDTAESIQTSITDIRNAANAFLDENGYVPADQSENAINAVYDAAKEKPGIISCEKDEYGVYIEVESGLDYVYMPEIENLDSGGDQQKIITLQPYYTVNAMRNPSFDHDGLDTCATDVSASDTRWAFQSENNVDDSNVTMDRILSLDDFKLILWHGHGGYTKKSGYFLCTTVEVTTDLLRKYPCLNKSNAMISLGQKLCLKSSFFRDNYSDNAFENAFIYLATCLSGKDRELANILVEKGAAVVFVNSDTIQRDYNLNMLHLIVESFCFGGKGTVSQKARLKLGGGYSFNSPENWSISDSLVLAKQVYGERDLGWIGSTVYYVGQDNVDRLTYGEWMSNFDNQTEANASNLAWVDAYAEVLEDFVDDDVISKFQLADLDGNGIPELLVAEGSFHFAGVSIYTYSHSEAVNLGSLGSFGAFSYNPQTGIILSNYTGMGVSRDTFYRLTDGSLELLCEMENYQDYSSETDKSYTINQAEVSREEYNDEYNRLVGTGTFVNIAYDTGWSVTPEAITNMTHDYTLFLQTFDNTNSTANAYSPDELVSLALDYYERHNGVAPSQAEIDHMDGNMYVIHLYDIVADDTGGHTATYAWYEVDEFGVGVDTILMTEVDLTA